MKTKPKEDLSLTQIEAIYRSLGHICKALKRGDQKAAEYWTFMFLRRLAADKRDEALANPQHRPRPLPLLPKPARPKKPTPKLPVMLDPGGFSPAGTPNSQLNVARLHRAGLDGTRADELWRQQQTEKGA